MITLLKPFVLNSLKSCFYLCFITVSPGRAAVLHSVFQLGGGLKFGFFCGLIQYTKI